MPRRAAAMPADAMVPGDAPRGWSERHGQATFERPGLTRSMPWRPSRLQSAVPLKPVRVGVGGCGPCAEGLGCAVAVTAMDVLHQLCKFMSTRFVYFYFCVSLSHVLGLLTRSRKCGFVLDTGQVQKHHMTYTGLC